MERVTVANRRASKVASETTLKKRRRLSELYVRGVALRFGPDGPTFGNSTKGEFVDEDGNPLECPEDQVEVWITPPNPLQREEALREAQAKRSLALIRIRDKEGDSADYLTAQAYVSQMDLPTLIDYVLLSDQETRTNEARRDVLSQEEWSDVEALQDALRQFEELEEKGELDTESEDYKALMRRDAAFAAQLSQREKELSEAAREALGMLGRDRLETRALEKRSDLVASQTFMREYEKQMSWYAVRESDDHEALFFETAEDLASEDERVQRGINDALARFINDGTEAKN